MVECHRDAAHSVPLPSAEPATIHNTRLITMPKLLLLIAVLATTAGAAPPEDPPPSRPFTFHHLAPEERPTLLPPETRSDGGLGIPDQHGISDALRHQLRQESERALNRVRDTLSTL